jgi:hypothetical protein
MSNTLPTSRGCRSHRMKIRGSARNWATSSATSRSSRKWTCRAHRSRLSAGQRHPARRGAALDQQRRRPAQRAVQSQRPLHRPQDRRVRALGRRNTPARPSAPEPHARLACGLDGGCSLVIVSLPLAERSSDSHLRFSNSQKQTCEPCSGLTRLRLVLSCIG